MIYVQYFSVQYLILSSVLYKVVDKAFVVDFDLFRGWRRRHP